MPRTKKVKQLLTIVPKKQKKWILYSSNREFCFLAEIEAGLFGNSHSCGCRKCDAGLELPQPDFMQHREKNQQKA